MKFLFISLFFIVFVPASHAQERYLLVSSGGGVAGTATAYKISPDGKVLKGTGLGEINYTEEATLKKCAVKKCFKGAKSLMESAPDFQHPGNLYTSITLYENGKENKVTWGDAGHAVPEDANKLFQKINKRLSKLTFTPDARK